MSLDQTVTPSKVVARRSYEDWNTKLLACFFPPTGTILEELDVSDESIAAAGCGDARDLLQSVRSHIRDVGEEELLRRWAVAAQLRRPNYLAFLVATCRVEWDREVGTFREELERVLRLNRVSDWIRDLRDLWHALVRYLDARRDADPACSSLRLPDSYTNFSRIGITVGLVFPRRSDRSRLREMFAAYREVEPPLARVVESLRRVESSLSHECRAEAIWFTANAAESSDERVRRFRGVLIRALRDALHGFDDDAPDEACVELCLWLDEDGCAQPLLLLADGAEVPAGFRVPPDEQGIAGYERTLDRHGGEGTPAAVALLQHADDEAYGVLSQELRTAIGIGCVPLVRVRSHYGDDWFVPALGRRSAESVEGRLIRKGDLPTNVAVASFGSHPTQDGDWSLELGPSPDASLSSGPRLRTVEPRISVSGLRDGASRFLCTANVRPRMRCDDAKEITLRAANGLQLELRRSNDGLWDLPSCAQGDSTVTARAGDGSHIARRQLDLISGVAPTVATRWPELRVAYWKPAPAPEAGATDAGTKLGWFLSPSPTSGSELPDTDAWQSAGLWLGPRVGDVSSRALEGFDWRVAESSDQHRRVLMFDGDSDRPTAPIPEYVSSDKAACRLWRTAFDPNGTRCLDDKHRSLYSEYSRLRNPVQVRQRLGRNPDAFLGSPTPRPASVPERFAPPLCERVFELELAVTVRASDRSTPLSWVAVWNDFVSILRVPLETERIDVRDVLRAWQETGALDVVGTAWQGTVVVPRKPRFLLRRRGRVISATLVGLANPSLRDAIGNALAPDWTVREKRSISPYVPPMLEATRDDGDSVRDALKRLKEELGLSPAETLPWADTSDLVPGLADTVAAAERFDRTAAALPVASPTRTVRVGETSIHVRKVRPRGQAPMWIVGPHEGRFALCTSPDWASRLATAIAFGESEFTYAAGLFRRDVEALRRHGSAFGLSGRWSLPSYLPLDAGRLLSILSDVLPGPVADQGYEYAAPTDFTGSVVADSLRVRRRRF